MAQLEVLVGLSGSGKSTYAYEKMMNEGYVLWSSDAIRSSMLGDENDQSRNLEVFEALHRGIIRDLKNGKNCIYDATCLSSKRRAHFLNQLPDNIHKTCVVFDTPIWVCIENDRKRERTVGEKVIWKQCAQFQMPHQFEGWNKIVIHNYNGPLLWDEAHLIDGDTPHESKWHKESIEEHMRWCWSEARNDQRPFALCQALMYHDMGKIYTKTYGEDGFAHFYNHENVSAYLFLSQTGIDKTNKAFLHSLYLIQYHMERYHRNTPKSWEKFCAHFPKEFIDELEIMNQYDEACRIP